MFFRQGYDNIYFILDYNGTMKKLLISSSAIRLSLCLCSISMAEAAHHAKYVYLNTNLLPFSVGVLSAGSVARTPINGYAYLDADDLPYYANKITIGFPIQRHFILTAGHSFAESNERSLQYVRLGAMHPFVSGGYGSLYADAGIGYVYKHQKSTTTVQRIHYYENGFGNMHVFESSLQDMPANYVAPYASIGYELPIRQKLFFDINVEALVHKNTLLLSTFGLSLKI